MTVINLSSRAFIKKYLGIGLSDRIDAPSGDPL
jgi:hypothetical protein